MFSHTVFVLYISVMKKELTGFLSLFLEIKVLHCFVGEKYLTQIPEETGLKKLTPLLLQGRDTVPLPPP